ncbi:MAG: CZB domain-containing protein [Planctomycetes bacterium]|nr:CZB domain-containing protein [Planctomycetota bacterium]
MDASHFDRGIAAHARWKYRLFDAINTGKSEWTVQDIRSHETCEFGKWLASLSPAESSSAQCKKVVDLHAEFHKAAAEVLEIALSGRKQEGEAAISLGSRFSLVSSDLTMAMSAWKEAVGAV